MSTPTNLSTDQDKTNLYGYLAMYNGKKYEVWTDKGSYEAQNIAAEYFRVPKSKGYKISVNLCVKPNNEAVIHTATE